MQRPFPTESFIATGNVQRDCVVSDLLQHSCWFEMTPLPDDQYEFTFKANEGQGTRLQRLFQQHDHRNVLQTEVQTYNGHYYGNALPDGMEEYGEPMVPVSVSHEAGLLIVLGADARDNVDIKPARSVLIERQTDRWMVCIARDVRGDNDLIISVLDDNRIVATSDCTPLNRDVTFEDRLPPNLPPRDIRYPFVPATPSIRLEEHR